MEYQKEIAVRWSDVDQNRHVRHSAYYDYGAHIRIRFFAEQGYGAARFEELNLGPIMFKEECSFLRELHPEDVITINLLKGDLRADGSRWVLHHEIFNQSGAKCAHLSIQGAWMDLGKRKLTIPPVEIAQAMHELIKGDYFVYKKT